MNFVFTDPAGQAVYVGTAAHCQAPPAETSPENAGGNDCDRLRAPAEPDADLAYFGPNLTWGSNYEASGRYVYNSYVAMLEFGETDSNTCLFNDFALIEVDEPYRFLVNPSAHGFGGPTGIVPDAGPDGSLVYTTGGTVFRTSPQGQQDLGVPAVQEETRERTGIVDDATRVAPTGADQWSTGVYFPGLCLPGDSGSPVLDAAGAAVGVIHAMVAANILGCEFTLLVPALEYMADHGGPHVVFHIGTESFDPPFP